MTTIRFDPEQRVFLIRMRTSYCAFRIIGDGQLVHAGSGFLPEKGDAPPPLSGLDDYEEANFGQEAQARRHEMEAHSEDLADFRSLQALPDLLLESAKP